jgi:hypothetical protein
VSEPKPFASLSSGLLARKGAARPAMRPQGFGQAGQSLEDLGWNDMGFEPPKPTEVTRDASHDAFGEDVADHPRVHPSGLTPVQSPVHSQQAEIVARVVAVEADVEADVDDDRAELYQDERETAFETEADADAEVGTEFNGLAAAPTDAPSPLKVKASAPIAVAAPRPAVQPRLPQARSAPGSKAKAAFTLRLAPDRHLKLRLACAIDGRSAQHLVTDALDQLLAKMPELDAMAVKANRKG